MAGTAPGSFLNDRALSLFRNPNSPLSLTQHDGKEAKSSLVTGPAGAPGSHQGTQHAEPWTPQATFSSHHICSRGEVLRLGACRTFAVVVLCELIASSAAAVTLAAERAHCIDAGFSEPAVLAALDALIDI